jgi:hypothetical protein
VRRTDLHRDGEKEIGGRLSYGVRQVACRFLAVLSLAVVTACATIPEKTPTQWLGVLPSDATLYVSMAVPSSIGMIKKALREAGPAYGDLATLLDMTKRLYLTLTLVPDQPSRFSAAAVGSYPSTLLGWRLGSTGDWKKTSDSSGSWYEYAKGGLQLSAPAKSVVLISNGAMSGMLPRLRESSVLSLPPEVVRDMDSSDILLYMPELPGGIAEKAANGLSIPIHEVWMDARKNAGGYEVGGTVNLSTEKEAKLFAMVMKLALVAWMRSESIANVAERLDKVTLTPEGASVVLSGLTFSDDEVIPVFLSLLTSAVPLPGAAE